MAQNDNTFDATNRGQQGGGASGANSPISGSGGGYGGNADAHTGTTGSGMQGGMTGAGSSTSDRIDQAKDKAADAASQIKDKASQAGTQVKDKAAQLKGTLADKLDAGAERLRQRSATGANAMDTDILPGETADKAQNTLNRASEKVAGGMEKSAEWMRTADMESMRTGIETQVRQNPGRALLVALGVGYVLGKVLRGSKES